MIKYRSGKVLYIAQKAEEKINFQIMSINSEPSNLAEDDSEQNKNDIHHFEHRIMDVFLGRSTFYALLGFVVGGLLVGRSLWEYGYEYFGLPATLLVGIIIFAVSGASLRRFRQKK